MDDGNYIKKPPNAFMLYMKEQRPNVPADISKRGSAAVNKFLAERWRMLTFEQKAKYYEQASMEANVFYQQHPDWNNSLNYGKKRRRTRAGAQAADVHQQPAHTSAEPQQGPQVPGFMSQNSIFKLQTETGEIRDVLLVQVPGTNQLEMIPVTPGHLPQLNN